MRTLTQPLGDVHRQFAGSLEVIHRAAETIDDDSLPELRSQADTVYAFLVETFIPHARAEEEAVYPLVDAVLGAPVSATMAREHVEVFRLAEKLRALRDRLVYGYFGPSQLRAMREVLYDLHAILQLHLAKENEIYLPLLDGRISEAEAIEMVEELHASARRSTELVAGGAR